MNEKRSLLRTESVFCTETGIFLLYFPENSGKIYHYENDAEKGAQ